MDVDASLVIDALATRLAATLKELAVRDAQVAVLSERVEALEAERTQRDSA